MKRGTILIIIGALALLGILTFIFGPYVYRDLIVGKVADAPKIETSVTPSANKDISADSAAGTWTVGADSYAGYRSAEVLNGVDITIVGRTSDVTGNVSIADSKVSSGLITVNVKTIATSEPERDSYFRSNVAETRKYPDATFELTTPVALSPSDFTNKKGETEVKGTLTLHGVSKEVSMKVQAVYDGSKVQIAGSIPVAWSDFGMIAPSLGFAEVAKDGSIEFLLNLTKS